MDSRKDMTKRLIADGFKALMLSALNTPSDSHSSLIQSAASTPGPPPLVMMASRRPTGR